MSDSRQSPGREPAPAAIRRNSPVKPSSAPLPASASTVPDDDRVGRPRGTRRGSRLLRQARVVARRRVRPFAWGVALVLAVGMPAALTGISCSSSRKVVNDPAAPPVATPHLPRPAVPDTDIRVLLVESSPSFRLSVAGPCTVLDDRGREVHRFPGGIGDGPVSARSGGMVFGGLHFACGEPPAGLAPDGAVATAAPVITPVPENGAPLLPAGQSRRPPDAPAWIEVVPATAGGLRVEGKRFPGRLRLHGEGARLSAVNVVDVEDYLPGVLAGELPGSWLPEAYKAQAVASRSFALYSKRQRPPTATYDVRAGVASQVYRSLDDRGAAAPILRRAVADTAGEVLTFQGRLVHAYFHSTCGGVNEPADLCWAGEPMSRPLAGGARCEWCTASTRYRWGPVVWGKDELLAKLRRSEPGRFGTGFTRLTSIEVVSRSPVSGRPATLRLHAGRGAAVDMSAYDFRLKVSEGEPRDRTLPSSFCDIVDQGSRVSFTAGRGFGHGVGLCQWGCQGQAQAGRSYRDMLAVYYPGAVVTRAR